MAELKKGEFITFVQGYSRALVWHVRIHDGNIGAFPLEKEGIWWIRGHHTEHSIQVKALLVAYALARTT